MVHVFFESSGDRHGGWDQSLADDGWKSDGSGPAWVDAVENRYGSNPMSMWSQRLAGGFPGQTIVLPVVATGSAVCGVVVRAADVDTYEVEIKSSGTDISFNQVAMAEGVQCWHDREAYFYTDIPATLTPGTLLQGAQKSIASGTVLSIMLESDSQPVVVHTFYDEEGQHGGCVVGRGHASLWTNLDAWHSKTFRDIGHLIIYILSTVLEMCINTHNAMISPIQSCVP
jgi:hypothetical protein